MPLVQAERIIEQAKEVLVKIEESGWIDADRVKRYLESNIYRI